LDRTADHVITMSDRFDRWASAYEQDRLSHWLGQLQRQVLDLLQPGPGDVLCDVGCGSGAAVRAAAAAGATAIGVDPSSGMLARARQLASGLKQAHFVRGTASHLPLRDGACSVVLCTTSFHHHPDPAASVAEMARVLAAGGRMALADFCADAWEVRIADWIMRRRQPDHIGFPTTRSLLAYAAQLALSEARVVALRPRRSYVALLAVRG
jgi:ubiquinone/menaquinone biosynthesis C-methylase UbiE